jgi:hypothetical protein
MDLHGKRLATGGWWVEADFARKLERERDEARQSLDFQTRLNREVIEREKATHHESERLKVALAFYADASDYKAPFTGGMGKLYFDCGQTARAALNPENVPAPASGESSNKT